MADFAQITLATSCPKNKNNIFVGFSMGGHVAFEIFRQAPESVGGLFLCNTSADTDTASRRLEREKFLATPDDFGNFRGLTKTMWPDFVAKHSLQDQAMFQLVQSMATAHGIISAKHQTKALLERVDSHKTLKDLGQAQIPAIICGAKDDAITPWSSAETMAKSHGNATLVELHSGHLGPLEDIETVSDALAKFLCESNVSKG